MKTIPENFFEVAKKNSQKTALLYKKNDRYVPITYQDLLSAVKTAGAAFFELGIKKGDRVAILSENRPEWVMTDLAVMSLGAILVPLHKTYNTKTIVHILKQCQIKVLVVSNESVLAQIPPELKNSSLLQKMIVFDEPKADAGVIGWQTFLSGRKIPVHIDGLLPDDVATIIYTSGTTGIPKGVQLTHRNIISNAIAIHKIVPVKPNDVFLSFLPLSHIFERTIGYYVPLFFGGTIAYAEGIRKLSQNLKEVRPTVLIAVPRVFEKFHDAIWDKVNVGPAFKKNLLKWALHQKKGNRLADFLVFNNLRKHFGGKLRLAISGGASLNVNLLKFFSKVGMTVLEGYGLTETSPVIATNTENDIKFGSVGKIIPDVNVQINEEKEILVRGENVFKGYADEEEATQKVLDRNGWFHTGDLGFIDSEGFLTIIGRKKDMFVLSGGKNIWPEPIENILNNDRFIYQSMVVGRDQKFVTALIVPDWEEIVRVGLSKSAKDPAVVSLLQKRLDEKINPELSDVEQVKKFIILVEPFSEKNEELTPTLKLKRYIIERTYEKEIARLYE